MDDARWDEIVELLDADDDALLRNRFAEWSESDQTHAAAHLSAENLARIGVVLAAEGGALAMMRTPFSLGIGGRIASGRQYFPWIHLTDLVNAALFCLDDESISGPVNAVAPESVRNDAFTKALGRVLRRPTLIPIPAFAVKAALGEVSGELLGSRRVVPSRLEASGFDFAYPTIDSALEGALS